MKTSCIYLSGAALGELAGSITTHLLSIGWYNLFFWAVLGMAIGWFGQDRNAAVRAGAIYGICLSLSFLLSGFQGVPGRFAGFVLFSIGLSIPGTIGGIISSYI